MENKSGIYPVYNRILVKPDPVKKTIGESELIEVPDWIRDQHELSTCYGVVVAVGPDCFQDKVMDTKRRNEYGRMVPYEITTTRFVGPFAEVGDRISYGIHSALKQTGEDGEKYAIMNDKDITTLCSAAVTQTSLESRKALSKV